MGSHKQIPTRQVIGSANVIGMPTQLNILPSVYDLFRSTLP